MIITVVQTTKTLQRGNVICMKNYKNKFDKEYASNFLREVEFLRSKSIYPTFIREVDGLKTYKFTKTVELFEALLEFHAELNK